MDFLSSSLKVPMGLQRLPALPLMIDPASLSPDPPPPPDPITISDRPLGEALSTFVNLDPRYSWSEIDGVIAIRPYDAWRDPKDPLNHPLPRVIANNRPTSEVIGLIWTLVGRPFDWTGFPETRPISIDVSNGTLVDVLNAVVRAHGNMTWEWKEYSEAEREEHVARIKTSLPKLRKVPPAPRYQLMFTIAGRSGMGWDVQ